MKTRLEAIKKSVMDIISFGLSARILSFIKGVLIAYEIGSSYSMDTYLLAFTATMLLTKVIGDGLTVSLVPLLQQVDKRDGMKGRVEFTNNVINNSIFFSIALILVGYIGAPVIIRIMGPGFRGEDFASIVRLFRIGLPIISFNFIRAICGGYLQSDNKFKAGAKSGVANNLIYIIYLLFFAKRFGLEGLMVAGIIAVMAQIVVMMKAMIKIGYKYEFKYNLKSRTLERLISLLFPIALGIGINEINTAVDNAIGSSLAEGTIATLNYADGIIQLILGLFIIAIVTALFPIMAKSFNDNETDELKQNINFGLKLLSIFIIPVSIVLLILPEITVKLFYERGAFGNAATVQTSAILQLYAIGLIGMGLILLIIRIYYAMHDTVTPMKLGLLSLTLNTLSSLILVKYIGTNGIAVGTSLSVLITTVIGIYDLNKKLELLKYKRMGFTTLKLIIAGSAMSLFIIVAKSRLGPILNNSIIEELALMLVSVGFGVSIYWTLIGKMKIWDLE